jgi:hypothetical protein
MGGGLLQLVAYGAQDVYLTGNPQITFFKVVYRRHTNFAIEAIQQSFNGNNNFGSRVSIQITRNGDLIHRTYFYATIKNNKTPNTSSATTSKNDEKGGIALVPYFGHKLLKTIELEIGGQRIDKHYSEWLYIWNELTLPLGKKEGYQLMVGGDKYNRSIYLGPGETYELYVPVEFWFCRNVGLALPLIALQYHEVKINIEYASVTEMYDVSTNYCNKAHEVTNKDGLVLTTVVPLTNEELYTASGESNSSKLSLENVSMWVDYIFLDTDERRRFAQLSHEYLIEQLQFTGADNVTASSTPSSMKAIRLNFNHPVKELIWVIHPTINDTTNPKGLPYWNNFSDAKSGLAPNEYAILTNPVMQAKLQLNGNDRFTERVGNYFSSVQPFQHHETCPNNFHPGINVYSFAIKPEEHQPSGTLNMSRIDVANLSIASSVAGTIFVYAVNYNVLRILSGMGGLAYSN